MPENRPSLPRPGGRLFPPRCALSSYLLEEPRNYVIFLKNLAESVYKSVMIGYNIDIHQGPGPAPNIRPGMAGVGRIEGEYHDL